VERLLRDADQMRAMSDRMRAEAQEMRARVNATEAARRALEAQLRLRALNGPERRMRLIDLGA
jgi:uncharacterized coiled-coil DUF342 family protein